MKAIYRLKKSGDFKKVLDRRQCAFKNESFSLHWDSNDLGHARIGLSVSSKLGNAVVRVRVKRQLRAQIDLISATDKPVDAVIIVKSGYLSHSFEENLRYLTAAFESLDGQLDRSIHEDSHK